MRCLIDENPYLASKREVIEEDFAKNPKARIINDLNIYYWFGLVAAFFFGVVAFNFFVFFGHCAGFYLVGIYTLYLLSNVLPEVIFFSRPVGFGKYFTFADIYYVMEVTDNWVERRFSVVSSFCENRRRLIGDTHKFNQLTQEIENVKRKWASLLFKSYYHPVDCSDAFRKEIANSIKELNEKLATLE